MKIIALSFVFLALSFTLGLANNEKNETQVNNNKSGPFNIQEVCKASNDAAKCASILKSLGGNSEKVKPSKFSDKVVKHAQSEFGHTSTKARKEMREDEAKSEVKKALSHCVKLYLDMNNELRGLYCIGLKSSNYGSTAEKFSSMAKFYPRSCENGLVKAGTNGNKLGLYEKYKDLEDLGSIVVAVTHYVSAHSLQKPPTQKN